ncbi:MAG: hypothetical protein K0R55_518 [Sporomusa sp.]|nr:hypothetical protein [Sporomusa sp.]
MKDLINASPFLFCYVKKTSAFIALVFFCTFILFQAALRFQ